MPSKDENGNTIWDYSNPEDKARLDALKLPQRERERQAQKDLNLKVTVDSQQMLDLIEEKKALKDELEKSKGNDISEVKAFFDAEKQKTSERLTALGIETSPEAIRNKDDLDRANKTIEALRRKESQNLGYVGGVPLSDAQMGISHKQGAYANTESMVNDLILQEKTGNKLQRENAKQILNQMTLKVVKGAKEGKIDSFDFPKEESIIDKINENYRRKVLTQRSENQ
jgi:hypothetical protein